jgi:DinB superfamily
MNPYASFLGSQDPLTVIADSPQQLRQAVAKHANDIDVPRAPGKWSPRQVLAHLAETEIAFAMRLRQTVADAHHIIQPFDQDAWSAANPNPDPAIALAMFTALRAANIEFIRAQPASMMAKKVTHPERGTMTFGTIVETMAGHDLNHLGQF